MPFTLFIIIKSILTTMFSCFLPKEDVGLIERHTSEDYDVPGLHPTEGINVSDEQSLKQHFNIYVFIINS